jgi:hypothetical protein
MAGLAFRLRLVETSHEWVIVCSTPYGESIRQIPAPYTADELQTALFEVEKAFLRSSAPVVTRRVSPDRAPRQIGDRLSRAILDDDVRLLFDKCRAKAREQGDTLQVLLDTVGPNVSRIPWELMTDPGTQDDWLALRLPIVRSPHLLDPPAPRRIEPPLRVLCVMSQPRDLPALETARERDQVSIALQGLSSELGKGGVARG